jgi:hypothetical protein
MFLWRSRNGNGKGSGGEIPPSLLKEIEGLREERDTSNARSARLRKHVENLHLFAKQMVKIKRMEEIYRFVADVCTDVFEFDRANILVADEAAGMFRCVETRGNLDEPPEAIRAPISPDAGGLYWAYAERKVIVLDLGTKESPRQVPRKYFIRKPWSDIKAFRSQSCIIGALLGRENPVGIFAIDKKFKKERVTEDDIGLVKLLRDIASYAILNLQTVEGLKVHQAELYGLISGSLASATAGKEKAGNVDSVNKTLMESSERIGGIANMIGTIADQTNLLSINAAIEASKAGAAGKSFGVVADEVKRLAGQTQRATDEVGEIVKKITEQIRASSVTMGDVVGMQQELIASIEVLHGKAQRLV